MPDVSILIPAAGLSLRMQGQDKLLMPIDGVACIRRITRAAQAVCKQVVVILPEGFRERRAVLLDLEVELIVVDRQNGGMGASLRAGLRAIAPQARGVMIVPADMPEIDTADLRAMKAAFLRDSNLLYRGASAQGTPGHPVIFPRRLFSDLDKIAPDRGAQSVLRDHAKDLRLVGLPDEHALVDLDTPQDWTAWTQKRQSLQSE